MMNERPFRLPPLNTLRVFHAVSRHHSFRAAADELLVSPQAVSQQIKLLEDTLGIELFTRRGRTIETTPQAEMLAHHVQAAFDEMEQGVRRLVRQPGLGRISLNVSPYFATRFLVERLGLFRAIAPDVDLRLSTMIGLPDFVAGDIDLAIQWGYEGQPSWAGLETRLLMADHKEICCTPDIARSLSVPADLQSQTLLHPLLSERMWGDVLAHLGPGLQLPSGAIRFEDAATLRHATRAGLGVGLISILDADEDLRAGRLVAPFGRGILRDMPPAHVPGFHLVMPRSHRRVAAIAAFRAWLLAQEWSNESQPAAC